MKIQLIDFGGRSPERAHANDAGADVFSPRDVVIRPGDICKLPLGFGLKNTGWLCRIHISKKWIKFTGNCVRAATY